MRLQYLVANVAWVFTFGQQLVRLEGHHMFFERRKDALAAAHERGLHVKRSGLVETIDEQKQRREAMYA